MTTEHLGLINPALLYKNGYHLSLSRMKAHSWNTLKAGLPRTGLNLFSLFGGADLLCIHYNSETFNLRDLLRTQNVPGHYVSDIEEFRVDQIDRLNGVDVNSKEAGEWKLTSEDIRTLVGNRKVGYGIDQTKGVPVDRRVVLPPAEGLEHGRPSLVRTFVFLKLGDVATHERLTLARQYLRTALFDAWWPSISGLFWSYPHAHYHCAVELVTEGLPPIVTFVTRELHRVYPSGVETSTHIAIQQISDGITDIEELFKLIAVNDDSSEAKVVIDEVLAAGAEGPRIEFKSSLRWDKGLNKVNPDLVRAVVKGLSAFMNTEGGTMFIGVDDHGHILGLEDDLQSLTKKPNIDGFRLALTEGIDNWLGTPYIGNVDVTFSVQNDKQICVLHVRKGASPAYLKSKDGKDQEFYIRADNSSRPLDRESMMTYIKMRWP